jgi:hypothetical protein
MNRIIRSSIWDAFFLINEPMRRRFQIHGLLLSLVGIVSMIEAWVRTGLYHPWRALDLWNSAKDQGSALELYAGMICLFLGVWLFSSNSKNS